VIQIGPAVSLASVAAALRIHRLFIQLEFGPFDVYLSKRVYSFLSLSKDGGDFKGQHPLSKHHELKAKSYRLLFIFPTF